MCRANFQDLLTELGWQSMQFVQSADVPDPACTRTSLGGFDVLTPDTRMTGQWLTEVSRSPHQTGRVSNPCSLSIQFPVATIVQDNICSQNQRPGNIPLPKHGGMSVLHEPNEVRILFHKIINDFQCLSYKSVC